MKIRYITLACALFLGLNSCDLDRFPKGVLPSESFWTSENDVDLALIGCYAMLDAGSSDIYTDAYADNSYAQYSWESTAGNVSAGNIIADDDYGYGFIGIRRFNNFLDNVDRAPIAEALKKQYKAEVRVLRAFNYYHLAEKFGAVPLFTKTISDAEEAKAVPKPEIDIMNFVLTELDNAVVDLPQPASRKSKISKAVALSFKTRVALTMGNYAKAVEASQTVMGMGYNLFTETTLSESDLKDDYSTLVDFKNDADKKAFYLAIASYQKLFFESNEQNNELIFTWEHMRNSAYEMSSGVNTLLYADNAGGGWSSVTPTQELVDAYWNKDGSESTKLTKEERSALYADGRFTNTYLNEFRNRDPRLYASISFPGSFWYLLMKDGSYVWNKGAANISKTGYSYRKLTDPSEASFLNDHNAPQDWPVIRYAEILLSYAEAKNELSGPDETIYNALQQIRSRVSIPAIDRTKYNTKETLRELIRNERRIELAGEGLRWSDIRRWGISRNVMHNIYAIDGGLVQERRWDDKFIRLPYPQAAVDRNPNLKDAQKAKGY